MNHADISKKNEYWISRDRYYELKHFCMQYDVWKRAKDSITSLVETSKDILKVQASGISNPVERAVESREKFRYLMGLVEQAAEATDPVLGKYIMDGVVHNWSYEVLRARMDVPCCKRTYYQLCRKFFWILSKLRG